MTKHALKFSLGALGLVIVGFGALFVLRFFNPEYKAEKEAKRIAEEIQQQYLTDTYGGDTPEETLRLFIGALKAGDTDLAAKYFVLDKQEEWKKDLLIGKENSNLEKLANTLDKAAFGKEINHDHYLLSVVNESKEEIMSIELVRNSYTRKWKLESL